MMHALRLSTALVVSMGLCGAALAQNTAAAGAGTQPEQTQQTPATPDTNAGMSKEQMHQGAGTPTRNAPGTNFNTSARTPDTTDQNHQEANPRLDPTR